MQTPNDDIRLEETLEPELPFDGAWSVWDAALVSLLLEILAGEQRLH